MAIRTVSPTGGNWNAITTWTGGVVPIAGDTVDFTALSGNITVNVSTANLIGIDFTNYVNTITFTNQINTSGTVNLTNGGYTQAGASGININGTATLSGTITWSRTLRFTGNTMTVTLANDITSTGTVFFNSTNTTTANPLTINGFNINIKGSLSLAGSIANGLTTGTTVLQVNGTSGTTVLTGSIILYFGLSIVINSTNNITMGTHWKLLNCNFTYISATSIIFPTIIFDFSGTCTIDVFIELPLLSLGEFANSNITSTNNNLTVIDLIIYRTPTFTMGSYLLVVQNNLIVQDVTLTLPNDLTINNFLPRLRAVTSTINGFTIYIQGDFLYGSLGLVGTTNIEVIGSGTIKRIVGTTPEYYIGLNLNINSSLTVLGDFAYSAKTFTYTRGVVKMESNNSIFQVNSQFSISSPTLINIHKINFANITVRASTTINMNEFFSGSPVKKTRIKSSILGTSYTITFSDIKKKISKYIRISEATITTRGQLSVFGDSLCNRGNNLGVIFNPNQMTNGIALNSGIVANRNDGMTFGASGLLNDPINN